MPRPVQVYSFGDFASRTPNVPPPGDRLDAQFRSHADAISELHRVIDELDGRLKAAEAMAAAPRETINSSLYYGAGGPYAQDTPGALSTSSDYAQVSIEWAEHMPDTIPPNILAVTAVSGDHWSSRWWANRSANAFGMLAWWYQGAWPNPGPPSTPNTPTGQPLPVGAMYYNTTTLQMYVWNGTAWVWGTGAAGVTTDAVAPAGPADGALWFDLVSGQLFVWADDGNSSQWVVAVNPGVGGPYLPVAGGTLTGGIVVGGPADLKVQTVTQAGAALSINRALGENCALSLTASITSVAVSGWPAAGTTGKVRLLIANTGAFAVSGWPAGTIWPGGVIPAITSGAGKKDIVLLMSDDGGTTVYGSIVGQDYR